MNQTKVHVERLLRVTLCGLWPLHHPAAVHH